MSFRGLIEALAGEGVRFVLVGGVAAVAHGSARLTQDLDVVYERSAENLERIVRALGEHDPYLRDAPPGLPFRLDVETLSRGLNFTLTTRLGDLDLFGEIPGGGGFGDLVDETVELELYGHRVRCLDLPVLIRTKRAAGRPRDLEAIAELEALAEERDGR